MTFKPRVSIYDIPNYRCVCNVGRECPYLAPDRTCDQPRTNKSKGDAGCHRMLNKSLLALLERITLLHPLSK